MTPLHLGGRRILSIWRVGLFAALVLAASWVGISTALADGQRVPSNCDQTLDAGFLYTCQTARYQQYGYTASGLTVWVQATLTGYGYTLTKDGYFGPLTDTKVRQWQTSRGLTSDGIVGNGTWVTLDPFGTDYTWVVYTSCNMTTGVTIYRTRVGSEKGLMACRNVGSGSHYLIANDFCVQTYAYYPTYGAFVPATWRDPRDFPAAGDCRDYWTEES